MQRNPSVAEFEAMVTTRMLGKKGYRNIREQFPRSDIKRIFRIIANSCLEDLGLQDEFRVINNPVSGAFLIYMRPRTLLAKFEIDGIYTDAYVSRPRVLLLDKRGGMGAATFRDLAEQKTFRRGKNVKSYSH